MTAPTVAALSARLAENEVVLIDGATGTELERRGVAMIEGAWCGAGTLSNPAELQAVHESHIAAGAQLITANTYASSRHILQQGGFDEADFVAANRNAIEVALAARAASGNDGVVIAGSISTTEQGGEPPAPEVEAQNYRDQAKLLADAGAELLMIEMMRDVSRTLLCIDAALTVGLPVWVGMACVLDEQGVPVMCISGEPLADAVVALGDRPIDVLSIMHTEVEDIDACLDVIEQHWDGPIGVYAQTGVWAPPHWKFIDVITPDEYTAACKGWVERGVRVIGGCCGIGPEHIHDLHQSLPVGSAQPSNASS